MNDLRPWIRRLRGPITAACLGLLAGCQHTQPAQCNKEGCVDNCATIPSGAIPVPAGTYLFDYVTRQAAKAEQDDFVVYKHEWYKGGTELGYYGQYHLNEMIKRLGDVPFPVVLQVSGDPKLDLVRRGILVARLQQAGIFDAEQRVLISFPEAEGLYGEEAERIFETMLTPRDYNQFGIGFGRNLYPGFGRGRFFGGSGRPFIDDRRGF